MTTDTRDSRLVTAVLVAIGALIVLPIVFMGFGMMGFGSMMGGTWGHGMWGGGPGTGWMAVVAIVMQLAFLVAIVGGGYLLYRAVSGSGGDDRALEELRVAYARGELSEEEYEKRRDALERDR
ncbi:SHOCT domain-containing protein [Natrinema sp. 1APR25-10V2]|uniref:SHOCT domain-containing protein n=1 Tax=Natrinema sp. 1APR25-10V2 TaxID=2951081 RepID=UPI002875A789|nr:SHOCT domain-containing protein [Natrinema sp. 1APR25-10V2]MDS0476299.1 SHOCT domain-containing protein [Natrinema sp. 1APR25-10V2]